MLTQGSETRTSENAAFYDLHLLGQKGLHSVDSFAATVLVKSHKVQPQGDRVKKRVTTG
jgi:hypothetical protein